MQLAHQRLAHRRRRLVDLPIVPRPVAACPVPILLAHFLVKQPGVHRRRRGKGTVLPKVCVTTPWPVLDSHETLLRRPRKKAYQALIIRFGSFDRPSISAVSVG